MFLQFIVKIRLIQSFFQSQSFHSVLFSIQGSPSIYFDTKAWKIYLPWTNIHFISITNGRLIGLRSNFISLSGKLSGEINFAKYRFHCTRVIDYSPSVYFILFALAATQQSQYTCYKFNNLASFSYVPLINRCLHNINEQFASYQSNQTKIYTNVTFSSKIKITVCIPANE